MSGNALNDMVERRVGDPGAATLLGDSQNPASGSAKILLSKSHHKVYDFRFDYNFQNLRRDGGEIYVRIDSSNHPGKSFDREHSP